MIEENRRPAASPARGIQHQFTVKVPRHHAGVNPRETCQHCGEWCGDDRGGHSFSPFRPVCAACCSLPDRAGHDVHAWGVWISIRDRIRREVSRGH